MAKQLSSTHIKSFLMKRNLYLFLLMVALLIPGLSRAHSNPPDFTITAPSGHTLYCRFDYGGVEVSFDQTVSGNLVIPDFIERYNSQFNRIDTLLVVEMEIEESISALEFTYDDHDQPVIVGSRNSTLTSITVGQNVRKIRALMFAAFTGLTNVTLGDSLTEIEDWAFIGCVNLQNVSFGPSVQYIGENAFAGCSSLQDVSLGASLQNIGTSAFERCSSLTSISIPNTTVNIGALAFAYCSSLTSAYIGSGIIADECFKNDTSLTSVTIGSGVSIIWDYVFDSCISLVSVSIPSTLSYIGRGTFRKCVSLPSIVIPQSITKLSPELFAGCRNLSSVSLPEGLDSIGVEQYYERVGDGRTFSGCTGLTTLSFLPNSLTFIGEGSFYGCTGLTNDSLKASVTYIGDGAFSDCIRLSLYVPAFASYIADNAFCGIPSVNPYLTPDNEQSSYGSDETWGALTRYGYFDGDYLYTDNTRTTLVKYFGDDTVVTIIPSVTSIGSNFPSACSQSAFPYGITTVYIMANISNNRSFNRLPSSVRTVVFGNSVKSVPSWICYGCSNLVNVVWGDSVMSIGESAFSGCQSLTDITFPQSVRTIGGCAFESCNRIARFNLPDSLREIGDFAFRNCASIDTLTIPASVTDLGRHITDGCDSLHTVYLNCSNPPALTGNGPWEAFSYNTDANIYLPCRSLRNYQNSYGWAYWSQCNLIDTCVIYRAVTVRNNGGGMIELLKDCDGGGRTTVSDSTSATLIDSTQIRLWVYTILPNTEAASQVGSSRLSRLMVNGSEFPLNDNTCRINDYSNSEGYIEYRIVMIVDTDMTIEALFVPYLPASVTVTASDSTLGQVSGGGSYYQYDEVVLSAFAKVGSTFLGWSNGSNDNPLTVELMSDTVLVAYFAGNNISDSVIVLIHDTTYINLPYAVHDTTYIDVYLHDTTVVIDTMIQTEYVPVYDTTYVNIHDTTYVDNYIHDTTYVDNYIFDTTYIDNYIYDTSFVTDTLWLVDTLYLHDTVYIHDTIYITQEGVENAETTSIKVYQRNGHVVVEDFGNEDVHLYDMLGRRLAIRRKDDSKLSADDNANSICFDVPSSGVYLIKVGNIATRKIIVVK